MDISKFIHDNIFPQSILIEALRHNFGWIKNSFLINDNLGSAKYKTVLGKWSESYPETTGYLIPTLLNGAHILNDDSLKKIALKQINYFISIQQQDGSFKSSKSSTVSYVFDTAQILLGLIALYEDNTNTTTLRLINNAYFWLIECLDNNGLFVKSNYVENYNPSYYARIVWPMLRSEQLLKCPIHEKTKQLYSRIVNLKNANYTFKNCSFDGRQYFYTHNLIYTYRGLWESSLMLKDNATQDYIEQGLQFILKNIIAANGRFNGSYNSDWSPYKKYICSVGNAQLICLMLEIFKKTEDVSYLTNISSVIKPLINSQRTSLSLNKGAVPSSIPIWGHYQKYKFTNWTQKFYSDALISLIDLS